MQKLTMLWLNISEDVWVYHKVRRFLLVTEFHVGWVEQNPPIIFSFPRFAAECPPGRGATARKKNRERSNDLAPSPPVVHATRPIIWMPASVGCTHIFDVGVD